MTKQYVIDKLSGQVLLDQTYMTNLFTNLLFQSKFAYYP